MPAAVEEPIPAVGAEPIAAGGAEGITAEDMAALLAKYPQHQQIAKDIVTGSAYIGKQAAWALIYKVATNQYTAEQLTEIRSALKVLAAEEGEEAAAAAVEHL